MGVWFSKLFDDINGGKECRVIMLGLDAGGKTTILYKLRLGEVVNTMPTIGFNVETVQYKNINFTVWDVGGQAILRQLWRHYYPGTKGIIYVVDSNDRERTSDARAGLHHMLIDAELLQGAPLLVLANKQDLPRALSASDITVCLGLHGVRDRQWHIQECCAVSGDGLYQGLDWLTQALNRR